MRPFGTSEQLAERRQRAFRLLRKGMTPIQVARKVGVTPPSVRRWRRAARQPVHPASRRPGRPCRLSAPQQQELVQALERGAQAAGWANDYWTVDRITHLIWDLFHVRYDPSGVWHLLQRLGWSCQKPQRRSLARKEEAVAHWKHYTWPQIKKVAAA